MHIKRPMARRVRFVPVWMTTQWRENPKLRDFLEHCAHLGTRTHYPYIAQPDMATSYPEHVLMDIVCQDTDVIQAEYFELRKGDDEGYAKCDDYSHYHFFIPNLDERSDRCVSVVSSYDDACG